MYEAIVLGMDMEHELCSVGRSESRASYSSCGLQMPSKLEQEQELRRKVQPGSDDFPTLSVGRRRSEFCKLEFYVSSRAAANNVCLTRALITKAMI